MRIWRSLLGGPSTTAELETRRRWVLALVVLAAAVVRFPLIGSARFGGDETHFFAVARNIAEFVDFPSVGPPITGGRAGLPGPLFYVITAVPLWIWSEPEACMVLTALQGIATVVLVYLALRRPFGEGGAAVAGLLLACSPWCAFASDRITTVVMFPAAVALWCAARLRENPASRFVWLFVVACAVMPQFHLSCPVLWAPLLCLVLPTLPKWRWRWFVAGVVVSAALYAPYLNHELRTGWQNSRAISAESGRAQRVDGSWRHVPLYALRNLTLDTTYFENTGYWGGPNETLNVRSLWSGTRIRPQHPLRIITLSASFALFLFALGAAAVVIVRRFRVGGWKTCVTSWGMAFVIAVAGNTALIAYSGRQVFGHYVQPIQIFLFILYGAAGMVAMRHRWSRLPVLLLVLLVCAGGIESTWTISKRLDARVGIAVERSVLDRIHRDGLEQGYAESEPVQLEFGFYAALHWYQQVSRLVLHERVRLVGRAPHRRYRLQLRDDPPPSSWNREHAPSVFGPVSLFQLQ